VRRADDRARRLAAPEGGIALNYADLLLVLGMMNWSVYSVLVPRRPLHCRRGRF
jgi:hypothetical protein